jgi:putative intracellular protease/amidase/YHS domain-containing protein
MTTEHDHEPEAAGGTAGGAGRPRAIAIARLGLLAGLASPVLGPQCTAARQPPTPARPADPDPSAALAKSDEPARSGEKLVPPDEGKIPVAFVISRGATVIDFTGPWEVFQDVAVPGRGLVAADTSPFQLFTVAETREPIVATGGMRIIPDFTFDDAPQPKVIVIPAQAGATPAMFEWLRRAHAGADLTMSVCTGAFVLASSGLLDGRSVTTHHEALDQLQRRFPAIRVRRDVRFVEGPRLATAAGLTSGIDLALRVVERYFGRAIAQQTASYMEHESHAWDVSKGYWDSGEAADKAAPVAPVDLTSALGGRDPVLLTEGREVAGEQALEVTHGRYRYRFASAETKGRFLADPARYSIQLDGACAFMATSGAEPGSGDPARYHVHDGRIYIFASENCRNSFKAAPTRYLPKER